MALKFLLFPMLIQLYTYMERTKKITNDMCGRAALILYFILCFMRAHIVYTSRFSTHKHTQWNRIQFEKKNTTRTAEMNIASCCARRTLITTCLYFYALYETLFLLFTIYILYVQWKCACVLYFKLLIFPLLKKWKWSLCGYRRRAQNINLK